MFIAREHEMLQAAACPEWQPPKHCHRQPRSTAPPEPPSKAVLEQLNVFVGDDGTLPLAQALDEVGEQILYDRLNSRSVHMSAHTVKVLFEALRVSIEKLLRHSFPIFWFSFSHMFVVYFTCLWVIGVLSLLSLWVGFSPCG